MPGDWTATIDIYCERVGQAFWAEPVNAITNAAFIVAAALVFLRQRRDGTLEAGSGILLALMAAIGIGSFLFHTVATRWAALADTLPILLFILVYLALTLRRGFGLSWVVAGALTLAFVPASAALASGLSSVVGGALGGSQGYLPAFLALLIVGFILHLRGHQTGGGLMLAAGLFAVSLTFRTLDQKLCAAVPFGTHFMWHVLNAVLLGWLVVIQARMRG
ncbi:MAG: ceramidase domain-containing protein [Rhodovibrionaceae bacterium]|nr:ceramidase domain-containing protein [Rhodovibrionaceae bacterium]